MIKMICNRIHTRETRIAELKREFDQYTAAGMYDLAEDTQLCLEALLFQNIIDKRKLEEITAQLN